MSRPLASIIVLLLIAAGIVWWRFDLSVQPAVLTEVLPQVNQPKQPTISGIVVPHHEIVASYRTELFDELKKEIPAPRTIVLISPNHYGSGNGTIQTRIGDWEIEAGTIASDSTIIKALLATVATDEAASFANEHGIKVVLPDIKKTFPDAKLVPLLLKQGASKADVTELHDQLLKACADCLLIASVDFSHYQPALLANLHDRLTKRWLERLDVDRIFETAEVDSPETLALLAQWARSHRTDRFVTKRQTNSGEIAANPDVETTTHLFGWYEQGQPVEPEPAVSFTIGGDMMFGRMIAHTFLKDGLWKSLDQLGSRLFWGTDAGIINLEGPVSDVPVPDNIQPNNLTFNFPPETIEALEYLKINAASLGNNHSANAGRKGLDTTHRLLDEAHIQAIGGPADTHATETAVSNGHNLMLHVIGFQTLAGAPNIIDQIKALKVDPKNRVLIFPHWGNEYQYHHAKQQEQLAHDWIDAGADVVIGAHPHVIQDSELYKGKPIIYSMGNLLFDQTFSKETQQGLILSGEFTKKGLTLFALPVQSVKLKPSLMRGQTKREILDRLYEPFTGLRKDTRAGTLLFFPA